MKLASMLTLETVAEAVLVAAAFFVLLILAVFIYQLFFHDASEQDAKETFHSLLETIDTIGDNKPVVRPFKLSGDYAIMDTAVENGECFIGEVSEEGSYFKVGQTASSTIGLPLYLEALPSFCTKSDCLCLCKSERVGLCNEIIECKQVPKKATQTSYKFFSKADQQFMQNYVGNAKKFDGSKIYGCVYINSYDKVYPMKIAKFDDQITFCSNSCDVNDPLCCVSQNYLPLIEKGFAELQKTYDSCVEETIAKTNPIDYFKLIKQGSYTNVRVDFIPAISQQNAQQKAVYRYIFDENGKLDETRLGEKAILDTKFSLFNQFKENPVESCKEEDIKDISKNAELRKEFIGTDNIRRIIELGKCPEYEQRYYLRIIRWQPKVLLYWYKDLNKQEHDLIATNAIDLELFNDELYVIPKSHIVKKDTEEYKKVEEASAYQKSAATTEITRENEKININDKYTEPITVDSNLLISINDKKIDISNNKLQKNTAQEIEKQKIERCDELTNPEKRGEYYFIQNPSADKTTGNDFTAIIEYGKCYRSEFTPEQIEEKQKQASNPCLPGNSDCVGSTATPEDQELATIAHLYLRVVKESQDGKSVIFYVETDTQNTLLDVFKDYTKYTYYFYDNWLYILDQTPLPLNLFNLHSFNLNDKQSGIIYKSLDVKDIDMQKIENIKKETICKQQLLYPFIAATQLRIESTGNLQLSSNVGVIKAATLNNLPLSADDFIYEFDDILCIIKPQQQFDFSEKSISYTANQKLSFVDIGIDRLCVKVE